MEVEKKTNTHKNKLTAKAHPYLHDYFIILTIQGCELQNLNKYTTIASS